MLIRLTLPLVFKNDRWPNDTEIQNAFRRLGLSLSLKPEELKNQFYVLEADGQNGDSVELFCTDHYRDIAIKNLTSDDASFSGEIRRYSIFFGGVGETRTVVIVTRVNEGEVSLLLKNQRVKKALESLEDIIGDLLHTPLIDKEKSFGRSVEFHSTSNKSHVFTGYLEKKTLYRSLTLNKTETGLIALSLFVFLLAFSADIGFRTYPDEAGSIVDPLPY